MIIPFNWVIFSCMDCFKDFAIGTLSGTQRLVAKSLCTIFEPKPSEQITPVRNENKPSTRRLQRTKTSGFQNSMLKFVCVCVKEPPPKTNMTDSEKNHHVYGIYWKI